MSSLAPLAQIATAPAFNGLFFATAATIIPVLFLAIAVQSRGYQNLLDLLTAIDLRSRKFGQSRLRLGAVTFFVSLLLAALYIVLYAAFSEVAAVDSLYRQQATAYEQQVVLTGTTIMIIATVVGPALAFMRALVASTPRLSRRVALIVSRLTGLDLDKLASAKTSGVQDHDAEAQDASAADPHAPDEHDE